MNHPDPWLHEKAASGDPEAQYELGNIYYFGKGVPVDMDKANEWYRKAADRGHRYAERALPLGEVSGRKFDRWVGSRYPNLLPWAIIIVMLIIFATCDSTASKVRATKAQNIKREELQRKTAGANAIYNTREWHDQFRAAVENSPATTIIARAYSGEAKSQLELSLEYIKGVAVDKSTVKAAAWLKLASLHNNDKAMSETLAKARNEIWTQLSPEDEKAATELALAIQKEIEAKESGK